MSRTHVTAGSTGGAVHLAALGGRCTLALHDRCSTGRTRATHALGICGPWNTINTGRWSGIRAGNSQTESGAVLVLLTHRGCIRVVIFRDLAIGREVAGCIAKPTRGERPRAHGSHCLLSHTDHLRPSRQHNLLELLAHLQHLAVRVDVEQVLLVRFLCVYITVKHLGNCRLLLGSVRLIVHAGALNQCVMHEKLLLQRIDELGLLLDQRRRVHSLNHGGFVLHTHHARGKAQRRGGLLQMGGLAPHTRNHQGVAVGSQCVLQDIGKFALAIGNVAVTTPGQGNNTLLQVS